MKKYVVHCSVGFVGMDCVVALGMPDDHTADELDNEAWNIALDHAESFGYYPLPSYEGDGDPEDEDDSMGDHYVDSIEGWAELYDPEKHDMLRSGGGSFESDFRRLQD